MPPTPLRHPAAPWRRWVIASAALASAATGTTFHAAAGGLLPGPVATVAVALALWAITAALLGDRPRPVRLAAAVALGQFLVHLALTAAAGHGHAGHAGRTGRTTDPAFPPPAGAPSVGTGGTAAPGTLADALGVRSIPAEALGTDPVSLALHRVAEEFTLGHASMALAHLFAGAAVGLWLAIGLNAGLLANALRHRRVHPALVAGTLTPLTTIEAATSARARSWFQHPPALRPQHHCRVVGRRGPPAGLRLLVLRPALSA